MSSLVSYVSPFADVTVVIVSPTTGTERRVTMRVTEHQLALLDDLARRFSTAPAREHRRSGRSGRRVLDEFGPELLVTRKRVTR